MNTPPASAAPGSTDPGVESLVGLVSVDPFTLSKHSQVELVQDLSRHLAWLEAVSARALAALAGPGPEYESSVPVPVCEVAGEPMASLAPFELYRVDDAVCDEVAAALRVSTMAARKRIEVARDLEYKLPRTRELLGAGVVSYGQALAVVSECSHLSVADARKVEEQGLNVAFRQTPGQTRASIRRACARVAPQEPEELLEQEFAAREVQFFHNGGVMATISATLPAPDAMAVWNALTACAYAPVNNQPGDPRTMDHKRADALTAWAQQAFTDPELPVMQGKKRLETQVVIDIQTLFGMADNPGELVGYGPIPAVLARKLAAESDSWRRLVTDSVTGHLLDYGTTTYQPPAALREFVITRDRTCQFPTCSRRAYLCDLDHVEAFTGTEDGGSTSADNLLALCRRHHRLKTHNHWKVRIVMAPTEGGPPEDQLIEGPPPETIIEWTSPYGIKHQRGRPRLVEPEELSPIRPRVDHTAAEEQLHQLLNPAV